MENLYAVNAALMAKPALNKIKSVKKMGLRVELNRSTILLPYKMQTSDNQLFNLLHRQIRVKHSGNPY